jgi:hypothetical protein
MIHLGVAARVARRCPSGPPRVNVYTGYDHDSAKPHHLDEVVPAGPRAAARGRRSGSSYQTRSMSIATRKTRATVNPLLDGYLETLDVEPTRRTRY